MKKQTKGAPRPAIAPTMRLQALAADAYELLIYGDIGESWWGESVTAKSVVEQLNALDPAVATINVRINSYGGSVADGFAIYNALKRHGAAVAVTVDGVAMSSASFIAMAGDTVKMPATSILMIHAPWGGAMGNAQEMRQYADVLDKFADAMTDAYAAKSGKDRADILALLTDGEDHYFTGAEAVAEGFADEVAGASADDDEGDSAADETARAFASSLLNRIGARGAPSRFIGLAIAAAMRSPPGAAAVLPARTDPNPPATAAAKTPPADAGSNTGATTMTEEQRKAAAKAALEQDKLRREAIAALFAPFAKRADLDQQALATLQRECESDHDTTPEAAGSKLLAVLGQGATPTGSRGERIEVTRDETETYRDGAIGAILNRSSPSAHKIDEKSRQFVGFDLCDMARDSLERAGMRTRGMSRQQIAVKALQSTSDFPAILENVVTKTLRAGYAASSRTFQPWTRQATLPDFKQISRVQLGGAPNLLKVLEGAEYEYGSIGEGAEKYAVQKYGRIVAITWETIINDDLDALTRIPQAFGASAGDLESDIVYAILNGNPAMADTVALFHASHGNLGTGAALSAGNFAPIAEMRQMMLLQKGVEGRYITVRPKFLIVPPELETAALQITNGTMLATQADKVNVVGPTFTPIVEPRLHDGSATAWYGAADPSTVDTIEYAYLEGAEGVFTETRNGFDIDGVAVKCRHVFGAKAIDHRGLFKNAGA